MQKLWTEFRLIDSSHTSHKLVCFPLQHTSL